MKNILWLASLLFATAGLAQSFEGTITWSIKYDITDPARKAEMEKQQKAMNDPAQQEKMKQMQAQMNSPEMKAMMDKNPQMKTQMEAAIKMLQGGNINSMLPAALTIKMKGGNSLTKIEGGTAAVETLYQQDKTQGYMLNRSAKTFTPLTAGNPADRKADSLRAKVTKTSETMKILDYTCTKYIVELSTERGALKQVLWTTTEIAGLDKKNFLKQRMGDRGQSFYYEGISGIPLRMEMPNPQMNMIMQVTGIKRESLPAADFTIPADYKELKGFSGTQPRQ